MTISLNDKAGSGLPRLAVDTADTGVISVTGDFTTSTTIADVTGKFAFSFIRLSGATAEDYTFILTIDGVEVWNVVKAIAGTNSDIFGTDAGGAPLFDVLTSFKLEVESTTDISSTIAIGLRKIL